MELNPYAKFLGGQDARAVLSSTPGLLHQAACAMSPEQLETPIGPPVNGVPKWCPREIVAHMADCELAFSFRLRQVLAAAPGEPPAALQPFDQAAWATRYANYDTPTGLELFRANRAWNLRLIGTLSSADFLREGFHPERGVLTFQNILETMAGHDLNHLRQMEKAAGYESPQRWHEVAAAGV